MKEASTLHGVTSGWIQEQKKKQIESWTGAERCLCKVTTGKNKHEDTISIQLQQTSTAVNTDLRHNLVKQLP